MRTSSQRKGTTKGSNKNRTSKKDTINKIAQASKTISKRTTRAKSVFEKEENKEKNITNIKESGTRRGKSKNSLPPVIPAEEIKTSNRKKNNIERKKKSCDVISNDQFLAKKKLKIEHVSTIDTDNKMTKKESKSRKNTKQETEVSEEGNMNNPSPLRKRNKISKNEEEPANVIPNKGSKSKISKEKKSSSNKKNQSTLLEKDELSNKNVKKGNKNEKQSSNNNKDEEYQIKRKDMIREGTNKSKDSMNTFVKRIGSQAYMIDDDKDIYNNEKKNIKMTFEVTNRFAVLGCDWDNISSTDVFYLFESYYNFEKEKKKKFDYKNSKAVKRVTIYTSKYGEQKLKYEEEHGPLMNFDLLKKRNPNKDAIYRENDFFDYLEDTEVNKKLVKSKKNKKEVKKSKDNEKVENTENILDLYKETDTEEENEKIRLYQIQRSRYYFALVECYSKEIVEFLYEELNDMDADFCINYLDLRIIDDNCSLDDYRIKESCEKIPLNYKFYYCVTSPLKHTCAKALWDENPKRRRMLSTKFSEEELRELDWKEYLASSSDDEEENNEMEQKGKKKSVKKSTNSKMSKIQKYRNLLLGDILEEDTPIGEEEGSEYTSKQEELMGKEHVFNTFIDDKGISETSSIHENDIEESLEETIKDKKMKSKKNKKEEDVIDSDENKDNEVNDVFKNILTPKETPKEKKSSWENYLDKVKTKKKMKKKAYLEEMKKKDDEIKSIISKKTQKSKKEKELNKSKKDKKQEMEDYKALLNDDNLVDERFVDLYKNKDFNLDITNPQFKRTKFNEQILQNKL